MTTKHLLCLASLGGALICAGAARVSAGSAEPEWKLGHFTQQQLAAAGEHAGQPLPSGWEGSPPADQVESYKQGLLNGDNDTAHLYRGNTLVLHVFISHTGGTWTESEKDAAGAEATAAKNWLRNTAPGGTNMHWDLEGQDSYWYTDESVDFYIPNDGLTYGMMNNILTSWGYADNDGDGAIIDDFTLAKQSSWGFDNVLTCWEPRQTGRSWAGLGLAYTFIYYAPNTGLYGHEWGHIFGFCDEYVEEGHCNGGIDCGPCRNWYVEHIPDNANCELPQCPSQIECIMRRNSLAVCDYTHDGWGWRDGDNDGFLDEALRYLPGGGGTVKIYEVPHYGWFYWNNVTDGMVAPFSWKSWGVIALRSPATADYDMNVFADNNHNFPLAGSAYGTGDIDFVVGDYNHGEIGDEYIALTHYSGDWSSYGLDFEGGEEILYPDGIPRSENWVDYDIARVYEVPLFAGETVRFTLTIQQSTLDLGMALFRSNGTSWWAGRAGSQWEADGAGMGGMEEYLFTVPETDVYGLVLFANTAVNGGYTIRIGGWPVTLAEETPVMTGGDLQLYNYDPNAGYWSFVGSLPQASTDVKLMICNDANYQEWRGDASDAGAGGLEYFAVDYNHAPIDRDYLRVVRTSGSGNHTVEWEHDADLISGVLPASWNAYHLGKIWDVSLAAGQPYFFREYHAFDTPFDSGLRLFGSTDGGLYKNKSLSVAASDNWPAPTGGEWFSYTAPGTDWYGLVLNSNTETGSGSYSLWLGPKETFAEDATLTRTDAVVWGTALPAWNYWSVFAARPDPGGHADVWLYGDDAYTSTTLAADDQAGLPVAFVVGDFNHSPYNLNYYPRYLREHGGSMSMEWEGGSDSFAFSAGGTNQYDLTWEAADVAKAWDLYVDGAAGGGRNVRLEVSDLSGGKDFGIAFFASNEAPWFGNQTSAVSAADASGVGGTESITVSLNRNDWYGFVVYNKTNTGGSYRVKVIDAGSSSVAEGSGDSPGLRAVSGNPFTAGVRLEFSLPRECAARLAVYDVHGREIRRLFDGLRPAGVQRVDWDGADGAGQPVASGVYFARLTAEGEDTRVRLVRTQ